jgi:PAS domain S-box-containing protein
MNRFDEGIYHQIFLNAPLGIAKVSIEGYLMDVNPGFCHLFGSDREQLLGKHVLELTHGDDVQITKDYLQQMQAGIISRFYLEKRYLCANGTPLTVNLTVAAAQSVEPGSAFFVAILEDVSEKNQYRQALHLKRNKYQSVLQASKDGFWAIDFSGRIIEVNDAYCRMSGYARDELLQMRINQIDVDETPEDTRLRIAAINQNGFAIFQTHHKGKDGRLIPLTVSAHYNPVLGEQILAFFHDRSEIQNATDALKYLNQELNSLTEALPDVVMFKDHQSRWRLINHEAERLFGFNDGEWQGKSDQELAASRPLYRDVHAAFARGEQHVWEAGKAHAETVMVETPDAERHVFEVRKTPLFSEAGEPASLLIVARDMTELVKSRSKIETYKKVNSVIKDRMMQAEDALLDISENSLRLLGQELHDDLGQQLSAAAMLADSLAHDADLRQPASLASIQQIKNILNDAVRKTRAISHGLYPAEIEGSNLISMLRELVLQTQEAHGIDIQLSAICMLPALDRPQTLHIYRIVQESLHNVIRHSQATRVEISVHCHPRYFHLTIMDNGIGITQHKKNSSGIGLLSMQQRAAFLNATLKISSVQDRGMLIELVMPLAASPVQ